MSLCKARVECGNNPINGMSGTVNVGGRLCYAWGLGTGHVGHVHVVSTLYQVSVS